MDQTMVDLWRPCTWRVKMINVVSLIPASRSMVREPGVEKSVTPTMVGPPFTIAKLVNITPTTTV